MIGSVTLFVGLDLRACASLIRTANDAAWVKSASIVDMIAFPFFFTALAFMGFRSFIDMRKPWLCPPNFVFYGTALFGLGEVFCGTVLSIERLVYRDNLAVWVPVVDTLARASLFFATASDTKPRASKENPTVDPRRINGGLSDPHIVGETMRLTKAPRSIIQTPRKLNFIALFSEKDDTTATINPIIVTVSRLQMTESRFSFG